MSRFCTVVILACYLTCFFALQLTRSQQTFSETPSLATPPPAPPSPKIHFREISAQAGLTTTPRSTSERRYVLETMAGGGVALFDCDNDGKLDIAVINDSTIEQFLGGGVPMLTLYHQ
jgi:enediyne biosynthesis protein E4